MNELRHIVGGELIHGSGEMIEFVDPSTGRVSGRIREVSINQIDEAVRLSSTALADWRSSSIPERQRALDEFSQLIEQERIRLVDTEVSSVGKLRRDIDSELTGLIGQIRGFASDLATFPGIGADSDSDEIWEPKGVVASILPWNAPLNAAIRRAAVTIATGGATVIKGSEIAAASVLDIGRIVSQISVPAGVVNVVVGRGDPVGKYLVKHRDIAQISFSGSNETGRAIATTCAQLGRPSVIEAGGKNAQIVLGDTDLAEAAKSIVRGYTKSAGQICTTGSRLLVEERVHDDLMQLVGELTSQIRVGSAHDDMVDMGPLISSNHRNVVEGFVQRALSEGIQAIWGGEKGSGDGFTYLPTAFTDVPPSSELFTDEVFGPVLAVTRFQSPAEAIELANATRFGLAASVWSSDIDMARSIAESLDVGVCWINSYWAHDPVWSWVPRRQSGTGPLDFGIEALRAFMAPKRISTP
jgi:betaine-aldehyde dehydrogenase